MSSRFLKIKYPLICFILLTGVGAHRLVARTPVDTSAYHARVKGAVEAIPFTMGTWVGEEVSVPPTAIALLRPNALEGRLFKSSLGDQSVTLAVVQCQDTRDMAGHYPPICYRASGWTLLESERVTFPLDGETGLLLTRYLFDRSSALETTKRWVYNALILPEVGSVADMPQVREAASSHRARLRGAAQIQLVLSGDTSDADQKKLVTEFLTALRPVVKEIIRFDASPGQ